MSEGARKMSGKRGCTTVNSENGKDDIIKDVYDFHDWMYSVSGFGDTDFPGRLQRIFYKLFRWSVLSMYISQTLILCYYLLVIRSDFHVISFILSILIIISVGLLKIYLAHLNRKILKGLKNRMRANLHIPWIGRYRWEDEIRQKHANILTQLTKWLWTLAWLGMTGMMSVPLRPNSKLKFFFPSPFLDTANSQYYVPIYIIHIFIMVSFILNFISHDMIFLGIILRMCDHLEIIKENLKNWHMPPINLSAVGRKSYFPNDELTHGSPQDHEASEEFGKWLLEEHRRKCIKNCIFHHQVLLKELKVINGLFGVPLLLTVIFGPLLVGILAFLMLSDEVDREMKLQQSSYAVSTIAFLFTYCYFGSMLADKFEEVRFAFYSCPWYDMDVKTRKLLIIVLLCTRKVGRVTASNFTDVSLTTFLSISKVSYNTVTLLRDTK